jgi:hypothetical protein
MILVLAGDAFWALNFGGSLLLGGDALKSKVQLGDTATFAGAWALLIFFVLCSPFRLERDVVRTTASQSEQALPS